jgi:uncharacterized protein YndB with AHSA1/START domain
MTEPRTITIERELAHPPEKVWRALTEPHLLAEWLMQNDFVPVVGRRFHLTSDWGGIDCDVLTLEPERTLRYTWVSSGLDSVVTWTLTPTPTGTHLRVEQTGFRADQQPAYLGAKAGWPRFLNGLEQLLPRMPAR